MTDFTNPADANLRLSNAERDEAVSRLETHAQDGRLDQAELASRISTAKTAVTRGDLAPLFADLPDDSGTSSAPASPAFAAGPYDDRSDPYRRYNSAPVLGTIAPLVSIVLFFLTGWIWGYQYAWLWFILIPIVWAVAYGVNGDYRRDRNRNPR